MGIWKILPRLGEGQQPPNPFSILARGAGVAFLVQVSGVGLQYCIQVFLARWMGTVEYGIYEYVISWTLLLAILAQLGLPSAVLRFISEYRVKEEWGRLQGVIRGSWKIILMAGLLLSGCGTGIILWIDSAFNFPYTTPMLVGIWMVPLLAIAQLQLEMARSLREIALAYAPYQLICPLFVFFGGFILWQTNQTLTSVPMLGISIVILLSVVTVQLGLIWQKFKVKIAQATPIYRPREWLVVAFPLLLSNGFLIVLNQTDVLTIGAWIGPEAVGIYSAATKTALWGSFALQSVNAVIAPAFAALYAQGDRAGLQKLVSAAAHWIFWPSLTITLGLIAFGNPILSVFGPQFIAARWPMIILALGQLVNAGSGSVGYLLVMTGHQNKSTLVFGCSALTNLILNAIAIPIFGSVGAAISTAIAMAMWNIWMLILVVKYLDVHPSIIYSLVRERDVAN